MPSLSLSPLERRQHRAAAHHLHPVVSVGAGGLTDAVAQETSRALDAHGLIKIRVFSDDRKARDEMLQRLCDRLSAAPVQHIGKLFVLWRPQPERQSDPELGGMPGPRVVKIVKNSKSANHRPTIKKVTVMANERVTAGGLIKRAKHRPKSVKKLAQT